MKTTKVNLGRIKIPGMGSKIAEELGISYDSVDQYFEWDEYMEIEIEIDENMVIVGGKFKKLN